MWFGNVLSIYYLLLLFVAVNSCDDFWKEWKSVSCSVSWAKRCLGSSNYSSVNIYYDGSLEITCGHETIDSRLMRCLNIKKVGQLKIYDCEMSSFDLGRFASDVKIAYFLVEYRKNMTNFESISFINASSLESVEIIGTTNIELLNLTFYNVPSLTHLRIRKYNYSTYTEVLNRPMNILQKHFYNLPALEHLDLRYNNIESFHPYVLRNLTRLEELNLERNAIKDLPSDLLKGLSNLMTFSISFNKGLTQIPSELLKEMYNLEKFYASDCSVSGIHEDLFSDAINLTVVYLNENEIRHLPSKLFKNNKNLYEFHCSGNRISTLPERIFEDLSKLAIIMITRNNLDNLPEDIFKDLLSLEILDLSENRIAFLPQRVFVPLIKLVNLDLSFNNFTKFSGKHPFGISKHLKFLELRNVSLKEWPMINWTRHGLTHVDFSFNYFEIVKLPIYTPRRMQTDLSNNNIKTIYIDDWKYGNNSPLYDIKRNEITCDKNLTQFACWLGSSSRTILTIFPDVKDVKCHGEEREVLDYAPFYKAGIRCPTNCRCFREGREATVDCSGKGMKRVPEVLVENAAVVDLSNNEISEFSNVDCDTWRNVTRLYLSNNSLTRFPDHFLSSRLSFLRLDGNLLTQLSTRLTNLIDVSAEFRIFLSRNRWSCDCRSLFSRDWLRRNREKIVDFARVSCRNADYLSSFGEFISRDEDSCSKNPEVNVSSSSEGWKIAIVVLSLIVFVGL